MRIKPRFIIGVGVIVAAIAYLIITSIRNTSEYYLTVPEVSARATELAGQSLRVAGRVKAGTIGWDPSTLTLKFAIYPIPGAPGEGVKPVAESEPPTFRVVSAGEPKPDMFAPDRDVIVEGKLGSDGVINATQVMTSCPSKYRPTQGQ
ncbi:MAG TPA: cytochrome c maturation protein CcmE [Candidatus Binataceae bacterium]|nr:cytochrome c maturation protein CcmE [Candidatus Binataceae bacterium]